MPHTQPGTALLVRHQTHNPILTETTARPRQERGAGVETDPAPSTSPGQDGGARDAASVGDQVAWSSGRPQAGAACTERPRSDVSVPDNPQWPRPRQSGRDACRTRRIAQLATRLYGRGVDTVPLRVDRADVRQADDELTLILGAAGVHVLLIRVRYDGWVDEVINGAGAVAPGPAAWTLVDRHLSLELDARAAAVLGIPRDCRLYLDVDDDTIRRVRAALLEILQSACFVVDTAEGRIVS
jgi:hypothetical protein